MKATFLMLALAVSSSEMTVIVPPTTGTRIPTLEMERIRVSRDNRGFALATSGSAFTPWGFNYDHDAAGRLLEDYWNKEWETVVEDFREMKALGANTVRIHLQLGRFMISETRENHSALRRLSRLLKLAEKTGLYLDITGLGCYHKPDVPQWYNALNEERRWQTQTRFWEAVASTCADSPAVFCYDLMNEPIVTEDKEKRDWTPGEFAGKYFVQRLTLDFAGRTEKQIAKAWVDRMVIAIRRYDRQRLVTVGAIPWALVFPGAKPLFYSPEVSTNLDFVSVHFYPKQGEVDKALTALSVYSIGKPLVIEEIFPLNCPIDQLDEFIEGSRKIAAGWIGFYWGKPISEYKKEKNDISSAMTLSWLDYFVAKAASIQNPKGRTHE